MSPEERQRARDRAADGVAPRHSVIILPNGWPPVSRFGPGLCPAERKRLYRLQAKGML